MAVQPPPAPVSSPPPPVKSGRSCFGCGCFGCLLVILVPVLVVAAGGYYFFVAQAQAAVTAPAALVIFSAPVDVGTNDSGYKAGTPGEQLAAGSSVRTGRTGHAAIQFPDGSYVRMSPDTVVTVTAAQLSKDGALKSAGVVQKVGRTLSNIQHLVSGASFKVGGHAVSAEVRGTEFEVLVRANGTNLIKVFQGTVTVSGSTSTNVTAGQQIDVDANGVLSIPRPILTDAQDPFAQSSQCAKTASAGNNAGTVQTSDGDNLTSGTSAEQDYESPGGNLIVALCYPGSLMSVTVVDPNGRHYAAQGAPPLILKVPNGPPGLYKAFVLGINVPSGGEPYSVTFASDAACAGSRIDTGTFVRETLSNRQIADALQKAGATGVTLVIQGTSPTSARLFYSSDLGGVPVAWTIVFYAATPNLGAVLTQVTVRNINVTTQVISRFSSVAGQSVSTIPADYSVDRVYSCTGSEGAMMVIEGHR